MYDLLNEYVNLGFIDHNIALTMNVHYMLNQIAIILS